MFASIASFFWGSNDSAAPSSIAPSPELEPIICSSNGNFIDDVSKDVLYKDENSPVPVQENLFSAPSLSDEEAGWVFVNNSDNKAPVEPSASKPESEPSEEQELPLQKREKEITKPSRNQASKRTRNIPSSALHSSSVLNALAELKPQQQAERRKRELRLNNKQLERSNKVLRVESSSNRPSKRRMMYAPNVSSRAVNNRKC